MAQSSGRTLKIAQYCLLPQIFPRFANLVFGGFAYLAFFVAQVYRGVRLLPEGHPFLNPSEIGNYSIPDVIGAAGKRLIYKKEYIDQVIIYYVILLGMLLLAFQTIMLVISLFAPQAAMALSLTDYFGNRHAGTLPAGANAYQDLAFIMLDRIFGIPNIFNSCVSVPAQQCLMSGPNESWTGATTVYKPAAFPWPFHQALHAMFSFYSTGLLIVALMIFIYLVVVIVAETAQTGVPFGKRFNKVWAPIRLIVAFGLLIPITYGLNSAQYIVLYTAKLGSNFATNGWFTFYNTLNTTNKNLSTAQGQKMIASPNEPSVGPLLQFMMIAHACKAVHEGYLKQSDRAAYVAASGSTPERGWKPVPSTICPVDGGDQRNIHVINAYAVKFSGTSGGDAQTLESMDFAAARTFFNNGDMTIRIGDRGCEKEWVKHSGHVRPTCGELVIPAPTLETNTAAGAYKIQEGYFNLVKYMWGEYQDPPGDSISSGSVKIWDQYGFCNSNIGGNMVQNYQSHKWSDMTSGVKGDLTLRKKALAKVQKELCPSGEIIYNGTKYTKEAAIIQSLDLGWLNGSYNNYTKGKNDTVHPALVSVDPAYSPAGGTATFPVAEAIVKNIVRKGIKAEEDLAASKYAMPVQLVDRGWAGAGLWYNQIARANGSINSAIQGIPKITTYPEVMDAIAQANRRNNNSVTPDQLFVPQTGQNSSLQLSNNAYGQAIKPLQEIYSLWAEIEDEYKPTTGNVFYDFLNWLFGTQGLFDLRNPANQDVHPLALMSSMGKSLVEASIRNLGLAVSGNILSSIAGASVESLGAAASTASTLLFTIIGATLGAGIILYYVLPFMPFLYFFFAVGNWIKSVFEAMVGVPLWALAHLRIDGDGLPGEAAKSGYFMIFEIFLRPILIVFGLIAAVSTFAAMATVLQSVFSMLTVNTGGTNLNNTSSVTFTEFARGPIDQLFYTVLYAVLMYIIAMSSFKMIDLIPNQIMRWLGVSINSFAGMQPDSSQSIMATMQQQGLGKVDQAIVGIQQTSKGAGDAIAGATK